MSAPDPIRIAVVGHTNAGKTSLLRTLTRRVDFGEVSDRPGTTRHTESIDLKVRGQTAVRFFDTPGLEDAVALLDYLQALPAGLSRPERVRTLLRGPEAHGVFEQEAKVLRALLDEADAAMLVIDSREPLLPKYRAELDVLGYCAKPVMPVLNFTAHADSRHAQWHQALLEANLHAQVEFDAVAPFTGAERLLYGDLATLLRARRAQLQDIAAFLAEEAAARRTSACRVVADALVRCAAMRREIDAQSFEQAAERRRFVEAFRADVAAHARDAVRTLLAVYAFRPGEAEATGLPQLDGRWEDDLFNPETLKQAGKRLGTGAVVGGAVGAVADLALAGLSLGAATALGATLGGVVSQGWLPLWRKLDNRRRGVQELTLEDTVLLLLASHLLRLTQALERRGHAAMDKLRVDDARVVDMPGAAGAPASAPPAQPLQDLLDALTPARGHPLWETPPGKRSDTDDGARNACVMDVAREVDKRLPVAQ